MSKQITIALPVPAGVDPAASVRLCSNGGSGAVDYNHPISEPRPLFPNGSGLYGWGRTPWGTTRFGKAHAMRTAGFGRLPWGRCPFGHGSAIIRATDRITACATIAYAWASYDGAGNRHSGTPAEISVAVHTAPPKPKRLKKVSYNPATDLLTLAVDAG